MESKHSLVRSAFIMYREDGSLDYMSDSLLYDVCYEWVSQNNKMSFEDFIDYYLETEG